MTQVSSLIAHALTKLARTPMNENEFHEITNFEYAYLNQNQNNEHLSTNPSNNKNDLKHTASNYNHDKPDYLKDYAGDPYFYQQNNEWYYVDDEGIAHPIHDERVNTLNETKQNKVFEDDFHHRTQNRYLHYKGLAYLSEIVEEEDKLEITTMDELKATLHQFARDIIVYFESQNIFHNRGFKDLSKYFVENGYYRLKDLPSHWITALADDGDSAEYRTRMLGFAIQEEMKK